MFDKIRKVPNFRRFSDWLIIITIVYVCTGFINYIFLMTQWDLIMYIVLYFVTVGFTAYGTLIYHTKAESRCHICQKSSSELKQFKPCYLLNKIDTYGLTSLCDGCLVRGYHYKMKYRLEEIEKWHLTTRYLQEEDRYDVVRRK